MLSTKVSEILSLACVLLVILSEYHVGADSWVSVSDNDTKLSKKEAQALQKFKTRMSPKLCCEYQKADMFLLRFLRHKNFDLNKAEENMLTQMKWRKDENMDNIDSEDWSDMEKEYPIRQEGFDRAGRPLIVWELGDWDIRKAAITGKQDRIVRWVFKWWDAGGKKVRELERQGGNVTRWNMVLDLRNINAVTNVNAASMPTYISLALGLDGHFPRYVEKIILLNTPGLFETVLGLTKPLLADETREALKVYGKNQAEWGPIVNDWIEPSHLPHRYGGTKEDPN